MTYHPILVRHVQHLTDARYFAAMGVDWMSIELNADPASFLLWHSLRDWVAGVKLAAEISGDDEMLMAKAIIDVKPDGIILTNGTYAEIPPSIAVFYVVKSIDMGILASGESMILNYDGNETNVNSILQIPPDKFFLQTSWALEMLKNILAQGYEGGICFTGGNEDKTGMRDYEVMDEMLEILR